MIVYYSQLTSKFIHKYTFPNRSIKGKQHKGELHSISFYGNLRLLSAFRAGFSNMNILDSNLSQIAPQLRAEVEAWVVNTLKVKMIKQLDGVLETEGKLNARKLFLVPIFTISEMIKKVENEAPELRTYFYKQLFDAIEKAKKLY